MAAAQLKKNLDFIFGNSRNPRNAGLSTSAEKTISSQHLEYFFFPIRSPSPNHPPIFNAPVLSPKRSPCTPTRLSIDTYKLHNGVPAEERCSPVC